MPKKALLILALILVSAACGRGIDNSLAGTTTSTTTIPATTSTTEVIQLITTTTTPPDPLVVWVDRVRADAVEGAAESFEAAFGIPVEVVAMAESDIEAAVLAPGVMGSVPDVFAGRHTWLEDLVGAGRIAPSGLGARAGEFLEVAIEAFRYGGVDYGVPIGMTATAFIRNPDLVPEAPAGFSSIKAICEDLADQIERCAEVALDDPVSAFPFLSAAGGYLLGTDDGLPDKSDIGINSGGAVEGGELLRGLAADGVVTGVSGFESALIRFYDGTTPFLIAGIDTAAILTGAAPSPPPLAARTAPFAVTSLPLLGGNTPRSLVTVDGFFVNAASEQPDAAAAFAREYLATAGTMTNLLDADPLVPAYAATADLAAEDPVLSAYLESARDGIPVPAVSSLDAILSALQDAIAALFETGDGASGVDDILDGAAAEMAAALSQ